MLFKKPKKKILNIEYVSQNTTEVPEKWHDSVCGIACVKMVINFMSGNGGDYNRKITIKKLIDEGIAIGGRCDYGWTHESLVRILRNHNIPAYPQEFRAKKVNFNGDEISFSTSSFVEEMSEKGIEKIIKAIDLNLPTIVSMSSGFNNNAESHLVLITGYNVNQDKISLMYHDPDSRDGVVRKYQPISLPEFKKHWRKMAIFVD